MSDQNYASCPEGLDVPVTGITVPCTGVVVTIDASQFMSIIEELRYDLCEFYYFRHPTLKPGFLPAQGDIIENAATLYPKAWAYLQSTEGQLLCKSEEEWQSLTQAIWHTNADGTTVGWEGIGGAPYYVQDITAGTLRLPDLRGMYAEAAGFDGLDVGGAHGDALPASIKGTLSNVAMGLLALTAPRGQ